MAYRGNDSTFLDQLALLRSGNYGGGYAQYGEAIQRKQENETLVELYNKFKVKRDDLMTTDEQVNEFSKDVEKAGGLNKNGLPEDLVAGLDLMGSMQRMESWNTLYQPYIQAFTQLGEDGVNVAKTLANDLSAKLTLEEKKSQIPLEELQYASMKQTFNWDRQKIESWLKDEDLKRDSFAASDYIMNSEVFKLIEGGDITTYKGERLKNHNIAIQSVIQDAKKHFGDQLSDSAILSGLKIAMDMTGKSFKFVERQDFSNNSNGTLSMMELGFMKGNLQQWTDRWNAMDMDTKNYFREYMKDPVKFKTNNPDYNTTDSNFEEMYNIYKPGGQYASYWTVLSGIDPKFNKMGANPVDPNNPKAPKMNMPSQDVEIIRMKDGNSFTNNDFMWNPQWAKNYANEKAKQVDDLLNSGNIYDRVYENGVINTYNTDIKRISKMSKK